MNIKKVVFATVLALMTSVSANAQFEKGKIYLGASLSGMGLSYNGSEKGKFGVEAKAGYFVERNVLLTGQVAYNKQYEMPFSISVGVGGRYYIEQNGLYLGATVDYKHCDDFSDLQPSVQLGYAFFLSRTVTVEPELYYTQSFKNHSDYSTIGVRIGVGVYLFKD